MTKTEPVEFRLKYQAGERALAQFSSAGANGEIRPSPNPNVRDAPPLLVLIVAGWLDQDSTSWRKPA